MHLEEVATVAVEVRMESQTGQTCQLSGDCLAQDVGKEVRPLPVPFRSQTGPAASQSRPRCRGAPAATEPDRAMKRLIPFDE